MITRFQWCDYTYFPYEKDFARREIESLFGYRPTEGDGGLYLQNGTTDPEKAARLTYFSRITLPEAKVVIPRQRRLESTAEQHRKQRQVTRYSAHSLHEYRGRYNPQVVRAIGNMLGLGPSSWVLDPFSGSGTTLLECAHTGWNAVGIDLNPLAVKIARSKITSLRQPAEDTLDSLHGLERRLRSLIDSLSRDSAPSNAELTRLLGSRWLEELNSPEYLSSWFPLPVLAQIVALLRALDEEVLDVQTREIFEVILSDQLRDVSLQEPADLRIRRRKNPRANYPFLHQFFKAASRRLQAITKAQQVMDPLDTEQSAHLGDIRSDRNLLHDLAPQDGFDAIITSPPYVSALPYIDTQRLSLVALGLLDPQQLRRVESDLIGAREIRTSFRRAIENEIEDSDDHLPPGILSLCRELLEASRQPGNGFRRRNRPALVYSYFRDMKAFFSSVSPFLKGTASMALVVGTNRTRLGNREFVIDTPDLLAELASYCGYRGVQQINMDTYPRYDLHSRNSITRETLLIARPKG